MIRAVLLKADGGGSRKQCSHNAVSNRINQQSYLSISTLHKILSIGPNVNLLIHRMSRSSNSHSLGYVEQSSQLGKLYSQSSNHTRVTTTDSWPSGLGSRLTECWPYTQKNTILARDRVLLG